MQWAIPLAFEEYYDHKPIKYSILKDMQRIKKNLPCTRVKKEINFSLLKFIINDNVMHIFLLLQVHVHIHLQNHATDLFDKKKSCNN